MGGKFSIDVDELDAIIADLQRTEEALATLVEDLERQIRDLQSQWEGLAAQAQFEAQQEWNQGMSAMREALAGLRAAARIAHRNYTGAAQTNLAMWDALG